MKHKSLILTIAPFVLAGCSAFGGKETFDCPNTEVGAACISARQVYSQTHVADRVQPGFKDGKPITPAQKAENAGYNSGPQNDVVVATNGLNSYKPPLPEIDTPLPIRTPAKVLRIRVFPWEDNSRDLNTGGYVYTEVEGRTWNIGEEQVSRVQANVISPLSTSNINAGSGFSSSPLASPVNKPVATGGNQTR